MPALARCGEIVASADSLRQAVRLGLAAEQYRARHHRLPDRLDDLVPDLIPILPRDPFDGKPMRMKRTEHGLIVYSIGPDMVDNDGTPLDHDKRTGDVTFEVSEGEP